MNGFEFDNTLHIESSMPVIQIARCAVVCTAEQFKSMGNDWEFLVNADNWEDVNTSLDTVRFVDELENTMGKEQMEKLRSCEWDRSGIMKHDDFRNHKIARAIPCENGQWYVVGVFKWKCLGSEVCNG